MSIDRTKVVYDIVKSVLDRTKEESITFDSTEGDDTYSLTLVVVSFLRAATICAAATHKLVQNGFAPTDIDITQIGDKVLMNFRVSAGSIKSL